MSATTPTVYMLCGFVGSGKTTYARQLEAQGVTRLSVDEVVFRRHGRHGVDYPESEHPSHWGAAVEEVDRRLHDLLVAGKSVVLDFGFWSREDRDWYKRLADEGGATWRLLYFRATEDVLRHRLVARNRRSGWDPNALRVEDRHFREFLTRFHPPSGEGEEVIDQG